MRLFGEKPNISCIVEVSQEHCRPRLILNLSAQHNEVTPSINDTMEREITPESIQFVRALPHILQTIWEADPDKGSV